MKTWILKSDLSRSPQAAFRMYACVCKKSKHAHDSEMDFVGRPRHYFLARKLKSQLKGLSKLLAIEDAVDMEIG